MIDGLSLTQVYLLFAGAAVVVAICGTMMTTLADRIADLTGLGEAITGAVLLGATTSLSGTVVSITAAWEGNASLAFSNGVGGIAAQTAFLALADMVWRRTNLEHASADIANIFQAGLLSVMLALPLLAYVGPDASFLSVHPVSIALVVLYVVGVKATASIQQAPMWKPVDTKETRHDTPDEEPAQSTQSLKPVIARFGVLVVILAAAGFVISQAGSRIAEEAGISQTAVGSLMTAVSTSLPELVTTVAAVRRGAAQLAVGGIIGGNVFDVLFLTVSDVAYRDGSLYHAIGRGDLLWIAVGLLMTAILILGLVARERRGPANIGTESMAMLGIYAVAVVIQVING